MHDHTFPSDTPAGHDAQHAPLPKSRATRRAHGQRNTSPRVHSARLRQAPRAETGPQRAQRRAAARGLTVGAPVRAFIGQGRPRPNGNGHPGRRTDNAGPGGATPLGRVDRLARYLLQRDVTTHVRHGVSWQPTPRQRRRLDKKSHRAVPPYAVTPESERLAEFWTQKAAETLAAMDTRGPAASAVIVDEPTRGFRVVDRRGEHRS